MLFIIGVSSVINGQQVVFSGSYGNSLYNEGIATFQLADSSYFVIGNSSGFISHPAPYLARISSTGVLMYDVSISRPWLNNVTSAVMKDSTVYLTGYTMQGGDYDFMLMRCDLSGNVITESYWGGDGWDFARDIIVTPADEIFIVGESTDSVFGDMDAVLICLDTNGTLKWEKRFGGQGYDAFYAIDNGHAQTLIMAGTTTSYNTSGDSAMLIVNTDLNGDPVWQTVEDYPGPDIVTDIHPNIRGGYFLCGQTALWYAAYDLESFLMQIDNNGDFQWISRLGTDNEAMFYSAIQLADTTFRMAGFNAGIFSSGKRDAYLQNADRNGMFSAALSGLTIGGFEDDWSNQIIRTLDGGFLLTGTSRSFGPGISTIYLIKTDSFANTSTYGGHQTDVFNHQISTNQNDKYRLFPNPVADILNIQRRPGTGHNQVNAAILDVSGRIIREEILNFFGDSIVKINTSDLSKGFYLLKIDRETYKFYRF